MWHYRSYEQINRFERERSKVGNVQDLKGSDRYTGSTPLYETYDYKVNAAGATYPASGYAWYCWPNSVLQQSLYNQAYARMREKLVDGSTLGTTIAEGRSSLEMISQRASSVLKGLRKLRKGDPLGFASELLIPAHHRRYDDRRRLSKKHWLSGHWLEYWLGIAPTIADIEKSIKVLGREPKSSQRVKVAAFDNFKTRVGSPVTEGPQWNPYISGETKAMSGIYVQVSASNPNVMLANQMGLLNPVAIAWELVPLSFVANWFYDVGSFLNSMDTFYGLNIDDAGIFRKTTYSGTELSAEWPAGENRVIPFEGYYFYRQGVSDFSLPRPVLQLPHLSWTRAATSISLIVQLFSKP